MILLNEMLSQGLISFLNITNANIVCDGNSLTAGGYSTSPYPTQLLSAVNSIVSGATVVNKGVNAQQTTQMSADAVTDIDALISSSRPNILCVWEVTNDIYYNGSATTAITNMTTYCQARKAAGWKIILMGVIDRNQTTQGGLTPTQFRAQLTIANDNMRQNFQTIGGNVFVDLISDARLQNAADTTYYVGDGVHLTNAGNAVVVQLIMQKINQVPN